MVGQAQNGTAPAPPEPTIDQERRQSPLPGDRPARPLRDCGGVVERVGLLKDADAFVAAHPGLRDINAGLMFRGPVPRGRGGGARGPFFGGDTVAIYIGQIWLATDVIDKNDIISITCWRARRDSNSRPPDS